MSIRILILVLACGVAQRTRAAEKPAVDLKPLQAKLAKLLEKHYPDDAIGVKLEDNTIHFANKTRKFMVHIPLLDGEWQEAVEETGPKPGGVIGSLMLREGEYGGMASVPQTFEYHYFSTLLLAPYSKKLDSHLYVHLTLPRKYPEQFVKEFRDLVEAFESKPATPNK